MPKKRTRRKWEPTHVELVPIVVSAEEHCKRLAEVGEIVYSLLRKSRRLTQFESIIGSDLETEPSGLHKQGAA